MKGKKLVFTYIISDFLSAGIVWGLFFVFRKLYIEPIKFGYHIQVVLDLNFVLGLCFVPLFWITFYYFTGFYIDVYRKTKGYIFSHTFLVSLAGVVFLFFALILNDFVANYKEYYSSFSFLFVLHFLCTFISRNFIGRNVINKIKHRIIYFNTLLIGSGKEALNIYNELENQPKSLGNKFIGYVTVNDKNNQALHSILPNLGKLNSLPQIVDDNHIEEVIIAIEPGEHNDIFEIIDILGMTEVTVKALPDLHTVLKGSVGISNIFGTPLIEIKHEPMSVWHRQTKLFIDIMGSLIAMIVLLPLYLFCALGIKLSSKGPIFLRQERIGRYGKPFIFYKFRSMYINAEKDGPNLASRGDCRVTPFGKFLRRTKFDEIPNFWNVLKGDMSLVGPRPERRYYIDQIVKIAPHYLQLQKIKPGITSLGQVKFGYAENVEQMTQRLRYDILYLENMSLYVDFKIFIYTVRLLLKGRHI